MIQEQLISQKLIAQVLARALCTTCRQLDRIERLSATWLLRTSSSSWLLLLEFWKGDFLNLVSFPFPKQGNFFYFLCKSFEFPLEDISIQGKQLENNLISLSVLPLQVRGFTPKVSLCSMNITVRKNTFFYFQQSNLL